MLIHYGKKRLTACLLLASCIALAKPPIPIESFAKVPDIQSVSMSADGKNLVAIVAMPGSNNQETGLATWDLDNLDAGSKVTPSGDRMKFIGASAMKANRVLVFGRQEWTGQLGGCGEGKTTGATKTFVSKAYLTDVGQKKFEEAFTDNTRKLGVSEDLQRCLEIAGTVQRQDDLAQGTTTEAIAATLLETHAIYSSGPFKASALYAQWDIDDTATTTTRKEQSGVLLEASYKVTEKLGVFVRQSDWSIVVNQDKSQTIAGLNYWPHEDVVFKVDYQTEDHDSATESKGFNLGLGYQF